MSLIQTHQRYFPLSERVTKMNRIAVSATMALFVMFAFSLAAKDADVQSGTWKMNPPSQSTIQDPLKSLTVRIESDEMDSSSTQKELTQMASRSIHTLKRSSTARITRLPGYRTVRIQFL